MSMSMNVNVNVIVVEASGLGKRYGSTWALRACTLAIPARHVAALVGPNGVGKTAAQPGGRQPAPLCARSRTCRWRQRALVSRADGASGSGSPRADGAIGIMSLGRLAAAASPEPVRCSPSRCRWNNGGGGRPGTRRQRDQMVHPGVTGSRR